MSDRYSRSIHTRLFIDLPCWIEVSVSQSSFWRTCPTKRQLCNSWSHYLGIKQDGCWWSFGVTKYFKYLQETYTIHAWFNPVANVDNGKRTKKVSIIMMQKYKQISEPVIWILESPTESPQEWLESEIQTSHSGLYPHPPGNTTPTQPVLLVIPQ